MSTLTSNSTRTEVAAWAMAYIDGAKTKWVPTTTLLRQSGIPNDSGNVGRRKLLDALHAMHAAGLVDKVGTGAFSWAISDYCSANGWDTDNPFATTAPKPTPSTDNKYPFGPGRLLLTGDTYTHRDTLKVQCGAKWDSDAKCWHMPDSASEKTRFQGLECYKSGAVKIDWAASGYETIAEPPVNRITPPAPSTNGHTNGKPHAEHAGKDHTAEIRTLESRVSELEGAITELSTDIKREEDRSAKLAERLTAAEKALAATPKTIKVEKYDGKTFTLKNVVLPKNFDRILSLAKCRRNILLVGPAGCGKSTTAKLIAQTLGMEFSKVGGSEGLTASHLLGKDRPLANKGEGKYETSDFVTRFEKGGVMCLDEMDAFDPNVFLVLNPCLDNGGELSLPNRPGKPCKKSKDFVCVGTANTHGRGGNRMYVRNQLDESSLDRFRIGIVECYYDEGIEAALCPDAELRAELQRIRTRVEEAGLRRVVSTRFLEDAYVMVSAGGWTRDEAVRTLFAGWSKDEIAKVSR